ncbi:MAG: hypothetical protein EOP07_13370 [Proteobacteria bacterium]|nr:MAG: hypothetical protein EOP07_13370 [Pseudomonadota bacterium]
MSIAKPLLLSLIFIAANAKSETVKNSVNSALESAQTKLYDLVDKDMTTVNFAKGGSALSEAELRNIRAVYKSVLADTQVSRVIVAAWSDREGIKSGVKLPPAQVNLAQKRAEAVKRILAEMSDKPIDSYNMAEDASWIEKTFRTKDAKVKEEVKSPGITPDGNVQSLAANLESKGGPGKTVVIVQRN